MIRRASAIIALLGGLCAARGTHAQILSPGDLSSPHAELDGDDRCADCHSAGRRIDDRLCTKCHEPIGTSIRDGAGLHGGAYKSKRCAECHVEHRGRDHDLVRWPGGSPRAFDHALAGWSLKGAHAQTDCRRCHTQKTQRGIPTYLGLATACGSCHRDPHEARLGTNCTQCHDERAWKDVDLRRFDHTRARFPLRGKHASVSCANCHGQPPEATYHPLEFANCQSCHQDPHRGQLGTNCESCHSEQSWKAIAMPRAAHPGLSILGGHNSVRCETCHDAGLSAPPKRGTRCVSCHEPVHEARFGTDCADCHKRIQWLGVSEAIGRSAHAKTPFALQGLHREVACDACHRPELRPDRRYRQLQYARCLDCHRDVHKDEFRDRDGGECRGCHDEHGFTPTLFGAEAHALTDFPLLGRHLAVPCGACHAQSVSAKPSEPRLDWNVDKRACSDCHANPHGEQFRTEIRDHGCGQCHSPTGWDIPHIDHSTWPLTGAHALASCASCHASMSDASQLRATAYRGVPRECEGCHDDPHRGQFRLSEPVRACGVCHGAETFRIAAFPHAELTGYALDGAHARVACTSCHAEQSLHNGDSTARWRLGYRRCADCHKNPHDGEEK